MSTFTRTVDCPRLSFEDGKPVECGCDVTIELEQDGRYIPASRWEPAEYPTVSVVTVPASCPEAETPYTDVEVAELERRAKKLADRIAWDDAQGTAYAEEW